MKTVSKLVGFLTFTLCVVLLSSTSSFAQKVVVAGNSGNQIVKNGGYFFDDEGLCTGINEIYPEQSSTTLIKANGEVKLTIQLDLTGSCLVPTSGGAVKLDADLVDEFGNVLAVGSFLITPSGMATYKVTFLPPAP